ncbi:MAG: hypothetical protein QXG00_07365 [Candidatus Woesearchaeota archaeon]
MSEENKEVSTSAEKKDEVLEEIREGTYKVGSVGEEEEESTEDIDEGRLLTGQKYETPKDVDKFIDTAKGEIVDKSQLSEFDVIKAVAKQTGTEIRNPRSGCKKCYGRGFIGRDYTTKAPIPCSCIYPPKTPAQKLEEIRQDVKNSPVKFNRKMFKQLKKLIKAERKLIKKQKLLEEQRLKKIDEEYKS